MPQQKLFLITGPSGVGKTTVAHALLKSDASLKRLITYTTRTPRPDEINDVDYHFVSREEFEHKLAIGDFFEHATVYSNLYGNCRRELQSIWDAGQDALMVLDIQGTKTVEGIIPEAISIFIKPDTMENLRRRIRERPMTDDQFQIRWKRVQEEMAEAEFCDFQVVNPENKVQVVIQAIKQIMSESGLEQDHEIQSALTKMKK